MQIMQIEKTQDGKIAVTSPFNPNFITKIKAAGAKWDAESETWQLDAANIETARAIMREVYGRDDQEVGETVSVRVTLLQAVSALQAPVVLFGRTIASARGRDTGARLGDGVCFEKGEPTSGGSAKNWRTVIPVSSVIILHDVPRAFVDAERANPMKNIYDEQQLQIEILETKIDRNALLEERARLLKRIEEIDALLQ